MIARTATKRLEEPEMALDLIPIPWQEIASRWTVEFKPSRDRLLGGTWTLERRIEIYVREHQTLEEIAFTVAHEIGHAIDATVANPKFRRLWQKKRNIPTEIWWAEPGMSDFAVGAGDFAECFAVWQMQSAQFNQLKYGLPEDAHINLLEEFTGWSHNA